MGSGDGTEVDLVALSQYAQDMGKIADDHSTWMQGAIKDMASTAGYMIQNAAPTFTASSAYHHYHQAIVNGVATGFLPDVWKGLGAYSEAAETAAINYASLEQLGTVDMSKVSDQLNKDPSKMYELFAPVFGAKGDATVNMDGQTVDDAFNPGKDDVLKSDPGATPDGTTTQTGGNAPSKTDIDNKWNQMVNQSNTDLKNNPDGSTLSQQQQDMIYGDHGYTVPNSTGVQVPANTVTRQDIEGSVKPDNPLK